MPTHEHTALRTVVTTCKPVYTQDVEQWKFYALLRIFLSLNY